VIQVRVNKHIKFVLIDVILREYCLFWYKYVQ